MRKSEIQSSQPGKMSLAGCLKLGMRSKLASCGNPSYLNRSQDDPVCDEVPIVDASSTDAPDNDDDDTEDEDADVEDFDPYEN